ncbi:MAG: hypothetical protein J1F22_04765 [Lachnospiraceae bacterium]|nr:hypothetical protein [Lachnospiraceae bacterium]
MRTVIVSVIGLSSILFVIMIQTTINTESVYREEIADALSTAMSQTMSEVMEKNSYGIHNRNEMIAAFLQAMMQKIQADIDLTVRIHQMDYETGKMDIEAIGEYRLPNQRIRRVSIRRQVVMSGN